MKRKKRILMTIGTVLMAVECFFVNDLTIVGAAETSITSEDGTVTFMDDLGRKVSVKQPEKVAALLGSYADIWFLAGGDICASADDAWEDFDLPLSEEAVNLGMTKELSLELLFASDPDFILASSNTKGNMEWRDTLESSSIPTAYFEVVEFEDYLRVLEICTSITGRADLYEKNGLEVQKQIEEVKKSSGQRIQAAGEVPTVLLLRASSSLLKAKGSSGNVLGTMLKELGYRNLADQDESLLEQLSLESILVADPDYILVAQHGDDPEGTKKMIASYMEENPAWAQLTAVKEGRVYVMDKELYTLKPNDRWGEAYEKLEMILSGEVEAEKKE